MTKRYRKCKLTKVKSVDVAFCRIHVHKHVCKIQAIWKGFLCRRRLNIFKNLPSDVWDIVLYHTKTEHNITKKYIPSVVKIYENRLKYYNKELNILHNRARSVPNQTNLLRYQNETKEFYKKAADTRSIIMKFEGYSSWP
tara:strand:+ start:1014 stop:1433 length:420 start_codon:yes stop_codon:yes gene_type:complete